MGLCGNFSLSSSYSTRGSKVKHSASSNVFRLLVKAVLKTLHLVNSESVSVPSCSSIAFVAWAVYMRFSKFPDLSCIGSYLTITAS